MSSDTALTPMMVQYRQSKSSITPDTLLLFRMGDFYEMFFEDAVRGSQLLDIALTRRAGVAMAGIPFHALGNYLPKILSAGVKVAIAEQMEDPKTAKGIVKREITQIITPGTIVDGAVLSGNIANFLVAVVDAGKGCYGLAFLDISTGDFRVTEVSSLEQLEIELNHWQPRECLLTESLYQNWLGHHRLENLPQLVWTPLDETVFDFTLANALLCRHFQLQSLDGFGCREYPHAVSAAGAVLHYAQNNLRRPADHITRLKVFSPQTNMIIDRISQRNLELVDPLFNDNRNSTLLGVLNHTITPMGNRLIREWILRPLLVVDAINARLDAITFFIARQLLLMDLRDNLKAVKDIERIITRLNISSGNARDLVQLERALSALPALKLLLVNTDAPDKIQSLNRLLIELPEIIDVITKAIADEPPLTLKEGGVIRSGYNADLDELRSASREGKNWIAELQQQEQERTGIKTLKVRFNRVFGYFIEVSKSQLANVPPNYTRKQTLVNAERFITPELKTIEDKIIGADEKANALEYELFQNVREQVIEETVRIQSIAGAIAELDTLAALAEAAMKNNYRRPTLVDHSVIDIQTGRHPVIEQLHREETFVPNDIKLHHDTDQLLIITGPNMAGKSTYIRQTALLVLMAQMGSYIPAAAATIGIVDRIFTRIGAADDLSRGQSTFMVEMLETANIMNNATARSLVILDEIGRGTSTYDGLSLAWAVAEHLHNHPQLGCLTLFATHYHELTGLAQTHARVKNYNVLVKETGGSVKFLHQIVPGAADKSYGIHVAQLAGLPRSIIERAGEILTNLEGEAIDEIEHLPKLAKSRRKSREPSPQPDLFSL